VRPLIALPHQDNEDTHHVRGATVRTVRTMSAADPVEPLRGMSVPAQRHATRHESAVALNAA
jgi:hypothetical protein